MAAFRNIWVFSAASSPLCSASLPFPRIPFHPPTLPPSLFSFQELFFASFHPFSAFSLLHFYLLNLFQPIFIFCLHLVPYPDAHAPSSSLLLCLPSCPPLHRRLSQSIWSLLFPRIWFIQTTMRRFVKSLSAVLLSGGGFKLRAVYLDILIGVNKFFFPPSPRTLQHRRLSGNAGSYVCQNIIRQQLMLTVVVVMALFAERCHGTALITAVLFTNSMRQ